MRAWLASVALMLIVGATATLSTPTSASAREWEGRLWSDRTHYSDREYREYRRERRAASRYENDDEDEARPRRRHRSTYHRHRSERAHYAKRRHTRAAQHHRRGTKSAHRRADSRHVAKARRRPAARVAVRPSPHRPAVRAARGSGQNGVASYYWEPQRVASGGWFNPNAMTAAHRSLPFGTRVRVTNRHNGRSVEVKINDRGPYIAGRIIDLSKAAASVIGMTAQGIARVTVEILGR